MLCAVFRRRLLPLHILHCHMTTNDAVMSWPTAPVGRTLENTSASARPDTTAAVSSESVSVRMSLSHSVVDVGRADGREGAWIHRPRGGALGPFYLIEHFGLLIVVHLHPSAATAAYHLVFCVCL